MCMLCVEEITKNMKFREISRAGSELLSIEDDEDKRNHIISKMYELQSDLLDQGEF